MKILSNELMKSIKFKYEENNIKYEEYYFNGNNIIPKNIEIKDISYNSININWEIDNNIDNNKIKYIIEIRKENEKFNKIYEGNNKNYLLNNLSINTNYEFRICSFYNDSYGNWSEIKKVKTKDIDSNILKESKREDEFISKILEWSGYKRMELIYRGSKDGTTSNIFHNKCDNKGPTIILFKNDKGNIYGGYCPISWNCNGGWQSAPEAFIFTLTNIYNIEPIKFNRTNDQYGIYFNSSVGPWFGYNSNIGFQYDYSIENKCKSYFGDSNHNSYQDSLGKGKSIFTGNLDNNKANYKIKEIEAFKLYK